LFGLFLKHVTLLFANQFINVENTQQYLASKVCVGFTKSASNASGFVAPNGRGKAADAYLHST